jgi:hypothetical protein
VHDASIVHQTKAISELKAVFPGLFDLENPTVFPCDRLPTIVAADTARQIPELG